jgi:hypothetical protein
MKTGTNRWELLLTSFNCSLKLIGDTQQSNLKEKRLTLGFGYAKCPRAAMDIFAFFPGWFCALSKDVYGVAKSHLVPWIVVIDSKKISNV